MSHKKDENAGEREANGNSDSIDVDGRLRAVAGAVATLLRREVERGLERTPVTVHGVLAGAYIGRITSSRALLTHASIDGGATALCKRVKAHNLCDAVASAPPTCPTCAKRSAKFG